MSGGQRQAVALARTKLSKAKVVLLDEPTAAISVRQVAEVLELIRQLKEFDFQIEPFSRKIGKFTTFRLFSSKFLRGNFKKEQKPRI